MKNGTRKILAVLLSAALLSGCFSISAFAATNSSKDKSNSGSEKTEAVSENGSSADKEKGPSGESDAKNGKDADKDSETEEKDVGEQVKEILNNKDESVYVTAAADGTVREIVVSDWIENKTKSKTVKDPSDLKDVETTKGDATFTMDSSNAKIWDAGGGDIYYKGNSDRELPVEVSVSYELDGKAITPDKLAGKSGKVKIRFDYENKQYEMVDINGTKEKIYVPFVMLTGMLLDNEVFSNVEVSNGKVINDGDRTAVIGFALPGLSKDLDIKPEDFDIPESVEITADVEDFELNMTATMASNSLFNDIDLDDLDELDELKDNMGKMEDAMNRLIDGSSMLYDGLNTLLNSTDQLVSGINALAAGAEQLRDGAGSLDEGAAALQTGAKNLYSGLSTLSGNGDKLLEGAQQVFSGLINTANKELSASDLDVEKLSIGNYDDVLNDVIDELDTTRLYNEALDQVTSGVNAQRSVITDKVTDSVREQVETSVNTEARGKIEPTVTEQVNAKVTAQVIESTSGMAEDQYRQAVEAGEVDEEVKTAVEEALDTQLHSEDVVSAIQKEVDEQMSSADVQKEILDKISEQMASAEIAATITKQTEIQVQKTISEKMSSDEIQSRLKAASEGAASVIKLKGSLDSYNAFYLGLQSYVAGVDQCAEGAGALKAGTDSLREGTKALYEGADALYQGLTELKDAMPTMKDGIRQLRDGSMQLSDGMRQFNEEGIQKLVDAVNGDIGGIGDRLQAVIDVSRHYNSYSGIDENMTGSVSFVIKTDSISEDDDDSSADSDSKSANEEKAGKSSKKK